MSLRQARYNSRLLSRVDPHRTTGRIMLWRAVACLAAVVALVGARVASADEAIEAPLLSYQVGEDGTISAMMRDGGSFAPIPVDQRIGLPLPAELGPVIEDVLSSEDPSDVLEYIVLVKQKGELVYLRRSHCHGGDCHCHPPC